MKLLASLSLLVIRLYQCVLSPFLVGKHCKFSPSCSEYAHQAITKYGFLKGAWKAFLRFARCHPLSRGGFDPV